MRHRGGRVQSGWGRWAAALACAASTAAWAQQEPSIVVAQASPREQGVPHLALVAPTPLPGESAAGMPLGLRWRAPVPGGQTVDITAWRRMAPPSDALSLVQQHDPAYGARVEMKIGSARKGLVSDYKFIGMQLDGGARIGLRRKDGSPTLYYRSQF